MSSSILLTLHSSVEQLSKSMIWDEDLMTASGRYFIRSEINQKGVSSMGSERPENCPVDSFQ